MFRLSRREILEQLVRLGVHGLSRLKDDCRKFERYWDACAAGGKS